MMNSIENHKRSNEKLMIEFYRDEKCIKLCNDVIRNGRVLGGLEPTRAFGDARYKWPRVIQETSVTPLAMTVFARTALT